MQRKNIKSVLEKISSGNYTPEEEVIARYWLHQLHPEEESGYSDQDLERVSEEMWNVLMKEVQGQPDQPAKRIKLWPRIAVVAAIAAVIFGAGLFFYKNSHLTRTETVAYKNDVAPGRQSATLTLASGKKIRLSAAANGKLANEAGVSITKTKDGQLVYEIKSSLLDEAKQSYNTLSTAKGETYQVHLPDGSFVFLNAASSLKYPVSFAKAKTRRVSLTGEGYFEIAKDKVHPFIVATDKQEVQVLGTHFNVNAYPDELAVATTLIEGSVKITSGKIQQIIKPGQQAVGNGNDIRVVEANIDNVTDWKDGDFYLNHVDFKTAMRKIGRWYDVDILYDASVPDDIVAGGWISRKNNLSAVLKLIEKSRLVHFKVEGKKVYVSK